MQPTITGRVWSLIAASSIAVTAAHSDTLYDTFGTKWRPISIGTGTTSEMVRNRLEVSLAADAAGDGEDFFASGLGSTCAVSGDFDLRATYTLLEWPLHNGTRVALHVGTLEGIPTDRGVFVERDSFSEADDPENPREVYVFFADRGAIAIDHETAHMSGRLRLQRVGSIVTGYNWSTAHSRWVELESSDVGTQDLRFALIVYSHDSVFTDLDVKVALDTVRLAEGTLTGAACPLPTT